MGSGLLFVSVFLQYSVTPVSGLAAGICMAEALEAVLRPAGFRRGLRCGLWLGAGLLMAYQTILITVPLLGLVLLRDRSRAWRLGFGGVLLGLLVGVLVQITMDRVHYGEWGASLWRYFLGNFGTMLARVTGALGFHDIARDIYRLTVETAFESSQVSPSSTPADLHQLTSQYFYVTRLPYPQPPVLLGCRHRGTGRPQSNDGVARCHPPGCQIRGIGYYRPPAPTLHREYHQERYPL